MDFTNRFPGVVHSLQYRHIVPPNPQDPRDHSVCRPSYSQSLLLLIFLSLRSFSLKSTTVSGLLFVPSPTDHPAYEIRFLGASVPPYPGPTEGPTTTQLRVSFWFRSQFRAVVVANRVVSNQGYHGILAVPDLGREY